MKKFNVEIVYELPVSVEVEAVDEATAIEVGEQMLRGNVDDYATSYYVQSESAEEIK